MTEHVFAVDPRLLGLPSRDELVAMRIWDLHFHGFSEMEEVFPYVDRMGVERLFALGFGRLRGQTPAETRTLEARAQSGLERWKDRVSGILVIDPSDVETSLADMERWIRRGPAVGIKYAGGNPGGVVCSHPDNDAIIARAAELNAVVYIHTWIKVGGEPRRPGGGNLAGESTPMDVAILASRFPDVPLICGHSGGDWELGVRAVRRHENVHFEFSGSDPNSGAVDLAKRELGIERIVWGGHLASRSYSTELSKVFDADLTDAERMLALGGNLRRLAAPILRRKGLPVVV